MHMSPDRVGGVDPGSTTASDASQHSVANSVHGFGSTSGSDSLGRLERRTNSLTATVAQLLEKLRDADGGVRREAVKALGQLAVKADPMVTKALAERLADQSRLVRIAAVEALVQVSARGDKVVVADLLQMLKHEQWFARHAAASTLGRVVCKGDAEVVSGLVDALKDAREEVVQSVLAALGTVSRRGDLTVVAALLSELEAGGSWLTQQGIAQALAQVAEIGDARVAAALLAKLNDPHEEVRRSAMTALPSIVERGDPRTVESLITQIGVAPDESIPGAGSAESRAACATLLGQLAGDGAGCESRNQHAIAVLLKCVLCHSESWLLRRASIESLSHLARRGDMEVVQALLPSVADEDTGVRLAAVKSLSATAPRGHAETVGVLLGLLDDRNGGERMPFLRKAAVQALGCAARVGDGAVVSTLLARLSDPHDSVREAAAEALKQVSEKGDESVVEALLDDLLAESDAH